MNASSIPRLGQTRPMQLPLNERRLNKPYMYKKVFEGGRVLRSAPLTLRYLHADEHSRFGFIIRKKVGDAPIRNSIRRTLRHCFVAALPKIPEGTWIVFDVPNGASQVARGELRAQADKLLHTVGESAGQASPRLPVSGPV